MAVAVAATTEVVVVVAVVETCRSVLFAFTITVQNLLLVTACAVATSCCISDEPCQWEMANFDPPQLRNFLTDRSETYT